MSHVRKQYTGAFKAKVALAATRGESTAAQLASLYEIHPTMINTWRKPLEDGASNDFDSGRKASKEKATEETISELYCHIGQLKVERDFFCQEARGLSRSERQGMLSPGHESLSLVRQCQLLGVQRSSAYHRHHPLERGDLEQMRLIDEPFLKAPVYGSRRMAVDLRQAGHKVNRKRVQRLMARMGLTRSTPGRIPANPIQSTRSTRIYCGILP